MAAEALLVLDTSVAAAWFFTDESFRAEAVAVLGDVREEPHRYVVPHLFHAELVHAVARRTRGDTRFVHDSLVRVLRLGISTLPLPEAALLRTATWACKGLGGYDATFVALAEEMGGRWLTADERAAKVAGPHVALTLRSWVRARGGA